MNLKVVKIFLLSLSLIVLCEDGFAQKRKKDKSSDDIEENAEEVLGIFSTYDLFAFPNVNKIPYYYDKNRLQKIRNLEMNGEWVELYTRLREYVARFAIQNFYKDTYLLWKLAKLTELFGDPAEARLIYKLVLKHHREDIDIRRLEFFADSLNRAEASQYVPIDYYYELADYRQHVDTLRPPRGVLHNMGNAINTRYSEYGPTLNISNDVLIFTSKRNEKAQGLEIVRNEDIFYSRKLGPRKWTPAQPIESLNTRYNEGSACLSKDGRTMYFARCNSPDSYGSCDIFVTSLQEDSTWTKPINLGININSKAWDSHPTLSHSEDTLFFASDRLGGFGMSDIYYSVKDKSGNWTFAQNAGPIINTRNNEVSPFYHPKYPILYFSSNGHIMTFGEFDIYKTSWGGKHWLEPVNIGPLVNGPGSEFYFTIDSESREMFYARSNENDLDNLDLYTFPLPMEAQPGATTKLKGTLTDSITGKPFKGIVSIIDLDNGIEVSPKFLNEDGSYEFNLINNNNYLLVVQGDDFFRIEEVFYLDGDKEINTLTEPMASKMRFESIEFDNGKADLKPSMFYDLDKIIDFLLDHPEFRLHISGHTDSDGSEDFNQRLSEQRAANIQMYIVDFGRIKPSRVTAQGYGSTRPIVSGNTPDAKKINRRVEFEIYRLPDDQIDGGIQDEF